MLSPLLPDPSNTAYSALFSRMWHRGGLILRKEAVSPLSHVTGMAPPQGAPSLAYSSDFGLGSVFF